MCLIFSPNKMKKFITIMGILFLISGCAQQVTQDKNIAVNIKSKCCTECASGAYRDVRGMDISFEPCSYYKHSRLTDEANNTIEILSAECIDYFKNNPLTVSECR